MRTQCRALETHRGRVSDCSKLFSTSVRHVQSETTYNSIFFSFYWCPISSSCLGAFLVVVSPRIDLHVVSRMQAVDLAFLTMLYCDFRCSTLRPRPVYVKDLTFQRYSSKNYGALMILTSLHKEHPFTAWLGASPSFDSPLHPLSLGINFALDLNQENESCRSILQVLSGGGPWWMYI